MKELTSTNYKSAAKLTFVSAFLAVISFLMDAEIPKSNVTFLSIFIIFILTIAAGGLMLKNIKWIKYVLLVSMIIMVIKIFLDPVFFFTSKGVMLVFMDVFSIVLQFFILFLLFKKPNGGENNKIEKSK